MYNDFEHDPSTQYNPNGPENHDYARVKECTSSDSDNVTINIFNGEVENRRRPWDVKKEVCRPQNG